MPDSLSTNPPRAWKRRTSGVVRRREPQWRQVGAPAVVGLRARRRALRLGAAFLSFAVSLLLLFWVLSWLWPVHRSSLVLVGAGYEENLNFPPNVEGWLGLQDLAELCRSPSRGHFWGSGWPRLAHAPKELRVGDAWDQGLEDSSERTIIVFLALHGGSDADGAYLLPQDADVRPLAENRLRLTQILDRLGRLPASKNKVLILDATQMSVNWSLGMLQNDFARSLDQLNDQIAAIPNLVVVSSSGPDQRSWASEEWRQTAFNHFFIEGMKGAASGRDSRINVWQLFGYVRSNVEAWAWSNRRAQQRPLLLPRGDEGRRRAEQAEVALAEKYEAPDPRQLPKREPPADLLAAWQRHHALAAQVPEPATYDPAHWREYDEVLLRYEELLTRGGTAQAVERLAGRLRSLEQAFAQARLLPLTSLANNYGMPAVAGFPSSKTSAATRRLFIDLWNTAPADQAKLWAETQAKLGGDWNARTLLRLQLLDQASDRIEEDPTGNAAGGQRLLQVLADPVVPPPVEVQYLTTLLRDLPTPRPPDDLIKLTLRTMDRSQLAALGVQSGTYPYSEQVYPWIQSKIDEADQQRRPAQDLLFAATAADWEKARGLLQQADRRYTGAQGDAAQVRSALALRDRVLARLPAYSRWVARQRLDPTHAEEAKEEARVVAVERLWAKVHVLVEMLQDPRPEYLVPKPGTDPPEPSRLSAQVTQVRNEFEEVSQRFAQATLTLTEVSLQRAWLDIDVALTVSAIDPELRMQLLANRRRIARQLLIETTRNPDQVLSEAREGAPVLYKEEAREQGRLALAELGERWFNRCAGNGDNFQQARHRLDVFLVEQEWWRSLGIVGAQVGNCWRQMPVEANRETASAHTSPRAEAMASLQIADRLARAVNGPCSVQILGDPTGECRRLRCQFLLLWLAQRTWEDHWAGGDDPYYRKAGLLFVNDAENLDPRIKPRQSEVAQARRLLTDPSNLTILGLARRAFTSEQTLDLDYRAQPPGGTTIPPGYPVLWLDPGTGLELVSPSNRERQAREITEKMPAEITCQVRSPRLQAAITNPPRVPGIEPTRLTVRGLYRGQVLEFTTRVELYPLPDTIVFQQPSPQTGSVAVRAGPDVLKQYGTANGAVTIVLDCSGSMGPPTGQAYGPTTKYAEALRALRQVLRRLPRGVTVSLWAFGQAVGNRKTVERAEQTIRRIQDPIHWDPEDANQLRDLMAKVEYPTLEPWNESPIVRAMVTAKDDLKQASGFKTLVVLTDGMDNRFARDRELNPDGLDIPTFLTQTFRDSGVVVNVVGYKFAEGEERKAEEQFRVVEKLPLPGRFVSVNESKELATVLDRALRQNLRYWVDAADNVPLSGQGTGLVVTPLTGNDQWFPQGLDPRIYRVRVHTDRRLLKDIQINRGDLLLVDMLERDGRTVFERGMYAQSEFGWKPAQEKSGWRLAVLQNQRREETALQMLLALEKLPSPQESTLQVLRPRRTWIEVRPAGEDASPFSQRWGYRPGYPAPTWTLDVPGWPGGAGPASPVVRAWWNPDQETVPAATLEWEADFRTLGDLRQRSVPVGTADVRIESVAVEEHLIEVQPGVREKTQCLVVRMKHPTDHPVWAEVRIPGIAGHEHRFYQRPGQYTGLFWPVTSEAAKYDLRSISVYSVPAFQKQATERGFVIEMKDLQPPEASDVRPRQPVDLK